MSDNDTPLERAVELFVYAPIGLAMFAKDTVPTFLKMFVARGQTEVTQRRKTAGSQASQYKTIGQMAVKYGGPEVKRQAGAAAETVRKRAEETLTARGRRRPAVPATGRGVRRTPPRAARPADAPPGAGELAIPGYDLLSASQVIDRLTGLTRPDLLAVKAYEAAHRARTTILGQDRPARPVSAPPVSPAPEEAARPAGPGDVDAIVALAADLRRRTRRPPGRSRSGPPTTRSRPRGRPRDPVPARSRPTTRRWSGPSTATCSPTALAHGRPSTTAAAWASSTSSSSPSPPGPSASARRPPVAGGLGGDRGLPRHRRHGVARRPTRQELLRSRRLHRPPPRHAPQAGLSAGGRLTDHVPRLGCTRCGRGPRRPCPRGSRATPWDVRPWVPIIPVMSSWRRSPDSAPSISPHVKWQRSPLPPLMSSWR